MTPTQPKLTKYFEAQYILCTHLICKKVKIQPKIWIYDMPLTQHNVIKKLWCNVLWICLICKKVRDSTTQVICYIFDLKKKNHTSEPNNDRGTTQIQNLLAYYDIYVCVPEYITKGITVNLQLYCLLSELWCSMSTKQYIWQNLCDSCYSMLLCDP